MRAGFILIPENGASSVMQIATRTPANRPVKRAMLKVLDTVNITDIRIKEIINSDRNAIPAPFMPGTVTA